MTIDRLLALGYLDDEAYARAWVAGRDRSRPRGAAALRRELLRKGLGRELVDAALHEREQEQPGRRPSRPPTPMRSGRAQGPRPTMRPRSGCSTGGGARCSREPDPRKRRQRAYALLARNGFDPGVCMDVTRAYLHDPDEVSSGQV